jgi:uncharacterized protein Yka (UPF0111/DUF47 family)
LIEIKPGAVGCRYKLDVSGAGADMPKARILDLLGEKALLLPALVGAAVLANERAKYVLALLQLAAANADCPNPDAATLRAEREACGITEAALDRLVARSEALGPGVYHIPEAGRLIAILAEALNTMLAPLALAEGEDNEATQDRLDRKKRLLGEVPPLEGDVIEGGTIAALTSGRPASGDGIHLLVMDLHKELNRLQASIAEEEIEGAQVYGLTAGDRLLVAAFMRGVQQTAALKFDHPGLTTTATRSGAALLIQNDIGETDAHVIVVRLTGLTATLTYSDVHAQRLFFFENSLAASGIAWSEPHARQAAGLADNDLFYIVTGKFVASDEAALAGFLERLGSRIVFLIDWNRARKRLRLLVPNSLAVEVLTWAAEQNLGHRAFLQLGAERLVYDAFEEAVRTPLRYGEKLDEMIGGEAARDYLRFVLATASEGLRAGSSQMLICDRVRAELFNHFRSAEERLLAEGEHHAAIIVRLAQGLCRAFRSGAPPGGEPFARNADAAKRLESEADEIVRLTRSMVHRIAGTDIFRRIVEIADDAADALEEAAFLAAVKVDDADAALPPSLVALADLALEGAKSFQRSIETAPLVHRGGSREPVQKFLEAADRVLSIEHRADTGERDVTVALLSAPIDCRQLYLFGAIARHLERATDCLLRASLTLRDHILGEAMFE